MSPEEEKRKREDAEDAATVKAAFAQVAEISGLSIDEVWQEFYNNIRGTPTYICRASIKQSKN